MPEQMTKQDAIEYLLYMKHDVQAKSPMDIALDAAIEALKQPTIEPEVRHGRWVFQKGDSKETCDGWICTNCKYGFHTKVPYFEVFKYCPMCGARMDGGADNG